MVKRGLLSIVALGCAGLLQATAIPTSSCVLNPPATSFANGFTCELYPSDGAGNFDGNVIVNFPVAFPPVDYSITPGFLVLDSVPANIVTDPAGGLSDPNQADWTQVLEFVPNTPGGFNANYLELFTAGCGTGNPNDTSCFPSYATILSQSIGGYDFEPAPPSNGVENYPCLPGPTCGAAQGIVDYYNIHDVIPTPTPEPSTMAIGAGGVAALFGLRRRRFLR